MMIRRISVPQQIAAQIQQEAAQLKPGDQLPTVRRLATRFAVSKVAVSEALALLERDGLIERRHGSGTYVRQPGQRHIAILSHLDLLHPRVSPHFRLLCHGLRQVLEGHGQATRLYMGPFGPTDQLRRYISAEFLEAVQRDQVAGVAVVAGCPYPEWTDPLRARGVPVVGCGADYDYRVEFDPASLIRPGVECLVRAGRRRLGLLTGGLHSHRDGQARAFQATLETFGLVARDRWIVGDLHPSAQGAGWEQFREIWSAHDEKPDGLLIADDMLLPDVTPAVQELGIAVPDQLMVVSHGNRQSPVPVPFPVTVMEIDSEAMAERLGGMLWRLMCHQPVDPPAEQVGFGWVEADTRRRLRAQPLVTQPISER